MGSSVMDKSWIAPFHSYVPVSNKTGLALNHKHFLVSDNCEKSGRKTADPDFSNTEKLRQTC